MESAWEREKEKQGKRGEKNEVGGWKRKTSGVPTKKGRRCRPCTVALWEICKFQKWMSFLIWKLPFAWWMREIAQQQRAGGLQFQATAFLTVQEVAEAYVVNLFEDANLCAIHAKRVMLMLKDIPWPVGSGGKYCHSSHLYCYAIHCCSYCCVRKIERVFSIWGDTEINVKCWSF